MSVTLAVVLAVPLPMYLQAYLQPIAIVLIYAIALSVFSAGRVPQMLLSLIKHSFNVKGNSFEGK